MALTFIERKQECEALLGVPIDAGSEEIEQAFAQRVQGLETGEHADRELRALAAERIEKLREARNWLMGFRDTVLLLNVGLNAPESELRSALDRTLSALRAESGGDSVARERKLARLEALQTLIGPGSGAEAGRTPNERPPRPAPRAQAASGGGLGRQLLGLVAVLGGATLATAAGAMTVWANSKGYDPVVVGGVVTAFGASVTVGAGLIALIGHRGVGVGGHVVAQCMGLMAAVGLFVVGGHAGNLVESIAGGISLSGVGRPATTEHGRLGRPDPAVGVEIERANASTKRPARSAAEVIRSYPDGFRAVWAEQSARSLGWVRFEGPRASVLMPDLPVGDGDPEDGWEYGAEDASGNRYTVAVTKQGRFVDTTVLKRFADVVERDDATEVVFVSEITSGPQATVLAMRGKRGHGGRRYFRLAAFGRETHLYIFMAESALATAWNRKEQELFFSSVEAW